MKTYLVYRTDRVGYDEYDSHVVIAENVDQVKEILDIQFDPQWYKNWWGDGEPSEDEVVIEEVDMTQPSHLLSSFNAG